MLLPLRYCSRLCCYQPGTDSGYAATRHSPKIALMAVLIRPYQPPIVLRLSYEMPSTDVCYLPTRSLRRPRSGSLASVLLVLLPSFGPTPYCTTKY
eukprot:2895698-Rhodomonas_salina.3